MIKYIFLFSLFFACGNTPCSEYCATSCEKIIACNITYKGIQLSVVNEQACEDTCGKDIAKQGLTDNQCDSAKQKVSTMTCSDFVSYLNKYGR